MCRANRDSHVLFHQNVVTFSCRQNSSSLFRAKISCLVAKHTGKVCSFGLPTETISCRRYLNRYDRSAEKSKTVLVARRDIFSSCYRRFGDCHSELCGLWALVDLLPQCVYKQSAPNRWS